MQFVFVKCVVLLQEYKYDVPVLMLDDQVILKHRFRCEDFEKALNALWQ